MRVHRLNRVMAVAAMAATAIIVTAPAAWAHPRLLSADPKPSTVAPGPVDHITVRFDEAVQWQYSTIGVEDTKGHSLLNGKPQRAIRGGRSLEIILLYVVLGLLMVRLFVLKEAPALPRGPGAATLAAVEPDRGYRMMRVLGIAAAVAMPLLFALYVARLDSAVGNLALGKVLFSSLGEEWAMKTLLWVGIAAAAVYGLRHYPSGARQHDLFLLSLAAAVAIAFGFNTHANGLSP